MKDHALYFFGAFIIICVFGLISILMFLPVPDTNKDMVNVSIGAVIGFGGAVVGYFYGSSKGSSDKDKLLNDKS
jgi:hypothetical protein